MRDTPLRRTRIEPVTLEAPVRLYFAPEGTPTDGEGWQPLNVRPDMDSVRIETVTVEINPVLRQEVTGLPEHLWPQRWQPIEIKTTLTTVVYGHTRPFEAARNQHRPMFDVARYALMLVDKMGTKYYAPHAIMGVPQLAAHSLHTVLEWYLVVTKSDELLIEKLSS